MISAASAVGQDGLDVRFAQLEEMRERQRNAEARLQAALQEASSEVVELQEVNRRNVDAAEQDLAQLTERLQRSLRARHTLEERVRRADAEVAELVAELQRCTHDDFDEEISPRSFAVREADFGEERRLAAAAAEAATDEHRRVAALASEAASAERSTAAARAAVAALRGELVAAAARADAEERVREAVGFRILRATFSMLLVAVQLSRELQRVMQAVRSCARSRACESALLQWRRFRAVRIRRRRMILAFLAHVFQAWMSIVAETARFARRGWETARIRRPPVVQKVFTRWAAFARSRAACRLGPVLWQLRYSAWRRWRRAAASRHWPRWVQHHCARRAGWSATLRVFSGWALVARASKRRSRCRASAMHQHRLRRAGAALRQWRSLAKRLSRIRCGRSRWLLQLGCCFWREAARRQHGIRRLQLRCSAASGAAALHLAFAVLAACQAAAAAVYIASERLHRAWLHALCGAVVLPVWHTSAVLHRATRDAAEAHRLRMRVAHLLHWRKWSVCRCVQRRRQAALRCFRSQLHRRVAAAVLCHWQVGARQRRDRRRRSEARLKYIGRRQHRGLCRSTWRAWIGACRSALRQLRDDMRTRLEELRKTLHAESALVPRRGYALMDLGALDRLHGAVAALAAAAVDERAAAAELATLESAVARGAVEANSLAESVASLRSELRKTETQMNARREGLEEDLRRALEEPKVLRSQLWQCEGWAQEAVDAIERAANEEAVLEAELRELAEAQIGQFRSRGEAAEVLMAQNAVLRRAATELQEALKRQQEQLSAQELLLEAKRREEALRDLNLFLR